MLVSIITCHVFCYVFLIRIIQLFLIYHLISIRLIVVLCFVICYVDFQVKIMIHNKPKKVTDRMIKELRITLGLTQEQFAAQLGVTVSTVNRWENNKGSPSPLARRRIKDILNETPIE